MHRSCRRDYCRKTKVSPFSFFFFLSNVHLLRGGGGERVLIEVQLFFELQIVSHCDFSVFVLNLRSVSKNSSRHYHRPCWGLQNSEQRSLCSFILCLFNLVECVQLLHPDGRFNLFCLSFLFFNFSPEDMLRGEGRERGWERNISQLPLVQASTREQT